MSFRAQDFGVCRVLRGFIEVYRGFSRVGNLWRQGFKVYRVLGVGLLDLRPLG